MLLSVDTSISPQNSNPPSKPPTVKTGAPYATGAAKKIYSSSPGFALTIVAFVSCNSASKLLIKFALYSTGAFACPQYT